MPDGAIDLIKVMQDFIAVAAPSGAALRNQEPGVQGAIQKHLAKINLRGIPSESERRYVRWLDARTDEILDGLTVRVRPWGSVRKALNLFMRACICDHYLRSRYALNKIEPLAEMPLDSIVARVLKQKAGRGKLPVWPGLKWLRSSANRKFQAFAADYARERGFPVRVYLDNYLFVENRKR
jgi:hypothetical protein